MVDNVGDSVVESADEGTDLVRSSLSYELGAYLENLTLTGSSAISGTGNALDNILIGNSGANQLSAGAGNDRLDGGSGNDTMIGGTGDDNYVVQSVGDVVIENLDEGTDTIESAITIAVLADNVENLILTGTSAISGTGNALGNVIIGNSGANTLGGGAGIDTLIGGAGNDLLIWDGSDILDGDVGRDTLLFNSAGTLDIDTTKAINIEVLNLGVDDDNDNGVALTLADVLDLASTSGGTGLSFNNDSIDLLIYGDNAGPIADNVDLAGGWVAAGTFNTSVLTGSTIAFDIYQAGGAQVAVQQGLDLAVA